jgi:hypothetical protein
MPRFSSYPTSASLAAADTFLIHQSTSGLEKQVAGSTVATYVSSAIASSSVATIAALKALSVTGLADGTLKVVSGYYASGGAGGGTFVYNLASAVADNGGTVIAPTSGGGRWLRPASNTFNVVEFGAKGDASTNDTAAIQSATTAAIAVVDATVYFPAGDYRISSAITGAEPLANNISFVGEGSNVSIITQTSSGANALTLTFSTDGAFQQPSSATVLNLGFHTNSDAGTAIDFSYGNPATISSHYSDGPKISGVCIRGGTGSVGWLNGIILTSAWNSRIVNTTISGRQPAVFTNLTGNGIVLQRTCINTHLDSVQINFVHTGLYVHSVGSGASDANTEGLFINNCSMVGVRKGVAAIGNASATNPYISNVRWVGGMVELRSAYFGFEFSAVQLSCITNVLILPETTLGTAVDLTGCKDITVTDNTFSGILYGVITHGTCSGINVSTNVHVGATNEQVKFNTGTSVSRSGGNVVNGNIPNEQDSASNTSNRIYSGMGYSGRLIRSTNQTTGNMNQDSMIWSSAYNSGDGNITPAHFWTGGAPTLFNVPLANANFGVNYVRLTAGIRWVGSATGVRVIEIKDNVGVIWASASVPGNAGVFGTIQTVTTPIIRVKPTAISSFTVEVYQESGGNLDVVGSAGGDETFFDMEILG